MRDPTTPTFHSDPLIYPVFMLPPTTWELFRGRDGVGTKLALGCLHSGFCGPLREGRADLGGGGSRMERVLRLLFW